MEWNVINGIDDAFTDWVMALQQAANWWHDLVFSCLPSKSNPEIAYVARIDCQRRRLPSWRYHFTDASISSQGIKLTLSVEEAISQAKVSPFKETHFDEAVRSDKRTENHVNVLCGSNVTQFFLVNFLFGCDSISTLVVRIQIHIHISRHLPDSLPVVGHSTGIQFESK